MNTINIQLLYRRSMDFPKLSEGTGHAHRKIGSTERPNSLFLATRQAPKILIWISLGKSQTCRDFTLSLEANNIDQVRLVDHQIEAVLDVRLCLFSPSIKTFEKKILERYLWILFLQISV